MASNFQGGVAEPEVLRLVKERDELRAALLDFEKHMEDIQNNVKALSSERDHFKTLFKQVSSRNFISTRWKLPIFTLLREQMFFFHSGSRGLKAGPGLGYDRRAHETEGGDQTG